MVTNGTDYDGLVRCVVSVTNIFNVDTAQEP